MNPYILESIARYTVADRLREGAAARTSRAAPRNTVPAAQKAGHRRRAPLTHAIWHGCTPATHGGLTHSH